MTKYIYLIPGALLCGQTMSCLLSSAMAVMLSVETKMDVPWRRAATGHAAG